MRIICDQWVRRVKTAHTGMTETSDGAISRWLRNARTCDAIAICVLAGAAARQEDVRVVVVVAGCGALALCQS